MSADDIDRMLKRIRNFERLIGIGGSEKQMDKEPHPKLYSAGVSNEVARHQELPESDRQRALSLPRGRSGSYTVLPATDAEHEPDLDTILDLITFVRVNLHSIEWTAGYHCEGNTHATRRFAPKGRVTIEFTFPPRPPTNGVAASPLQQKTHTALVRTTLPNHWTIGVRRVFALTVTEVIRETWQHDRMTFRIICADNPKSPRTLGIAYLPLDRLFTLPCSIEAQVPIYPSAHSDQIIGAIGVDVQLGSRTAQVNEQLERLRAQSTNERQFVHLTEREEEIQKQPTVQRSLSYSMPHQSPTRSVSRSAPRTPAKEKVETHNHSANLVPRVDVDAYEELLRRRKERRVTVKSPDQRNAVVYSPDWAQQRRRTKPPATTATAEAPATSAIANEESYFLRLIVHSAEQLPLVKPTHPTSGRAQLPNVFVTYRASNDRLMRSPLVQSTRSPVWNWTSVVPVSPERKNIVIKLWHRPSAYCANDSTEPSSHDRVLGFIAIDLSQLPKNSAQKMSGYYDLTDLSQMSTGRVKLTLQRLCMDDLLDDYSQHEASFIQPAEVVRDTISPLCTNSRDPSPQKLNRSMNTSWTGESLAVQTNPMPPPQQVIVPQLSPVDAYLETVSASVMASKMRENLRELENITQRIKIINQY